jgi:hypothetical protein
VRGSFLVFPGDGDGRGGGQVAVSGGVAGGSWTAHLVFGGMPGCDGVALLPLRVFLEGGAEVVLAS